jgi:hypothetical protein
MVWESATEEKLKQIMAKMPVFLRPVAEKAVREKAEELALRGGRSEIAEKDLVDALFETTPFGFQGLMKNDLVSVGIDVTQYGYMK